MSDETVPSKATNPKDALAGDRVPLHLCPDTLRVAAAMAFLEGACKYGASNWRVAGVRASVYRSALERHMIAWWNGEEIDPDSGLPHLWKMAACLAILIDATAIGKLVDDRAPSFDAGTLLKSLEPTAAAIKERFKDRNPRHWTIADSEKAPK